MNDEKQEYALPEECCAKCSRRKPDKSCKHDANPCDFDWCDDFRK